MAIVAANSPGSEPRALGQVAHPRFETFNNLAEETFTRHATWLNCSQLAHFSQLPTGRWQHFSKESGAIRVVPRPRGVGGRGGKFVIFN